MTLKDKVAIVTGGSSGIGKAIALRLAAAGAKVAIAGRNLENAQKTAHEIGPQAIAIKVDVTDENQVESMVDQTYEHFCGLDILVANAGSPIVFSPTTELTSENWDKGLDLNCKSVFFSVKHAVPKFPDKGGRIIITSSISGRSGGGPGMLTYAASKGAVNNMIRSWAKEFAPKGITVNGIAPGVIWTKIHERITPPDEYKKLIEKIPLGRDGKPKDCAGAVLLLASDEGSYITGQIIEINGGLQMP